MNTLRPAEEMQVDEGNDGRCLQWFTPCRLTPRPDISEDIENGPYFLVEH